MKSITSETESTKKCEEEEVVLFYILFPLQKVSSVLT